MSHPLPRTLSMARVILFLFTFPLVAGCGATGSGYFADRTPSASDDDLAMAASSEAPSASISANGEAFDERPETANRDAFPQETGVNQRRAEPAGWDVPDEPTMEIPSTAVNPSISEKNRGTVLEKPPVLDAAPAPETTPAVEPTATRETTGPRARPVAKPQLGGLERGKVHQVETEDFRAAVLESSVPVMVDFYADWCGPCKQVAPLLDQFARERTDMRVVKVNIDDQPRLAQKYRVKAVPTVMVFKKGTRVAEHMGLPKIRKALNR